MKSTGYSGVDRRHGCGMKFLYQSCPTPASLGWVWGGTILLTIHRISKITDSHTYSKADMRRLLSLRLCFEALNLWVEMVEPMRLPPGASMTLLVPP